MEVIAGINMSQVELAKRMGITTKHVSQLISGKASLSEETALKLEKVLDVRAGFWSGLEGQYRLYLAREQELEALKSKESWLSNFPIKEMVRREIIPVASSNLEFVDIVLRFFGVATPEAWDNKWGGEQAPLSYRASKTYAANPYAVAVWLRLGQLAAARQNIPEYNKEKFKSILPELRKLTTTPDVSFQVKLKDLCALCGVVVLFVPELPKTTLPGAAHWDGGKPIIQLSLRHKTNDHLWFSFFHEVKHILSHSSRSIYINERNPESKEEQEANAFARDFLIPPKEYRRLVACGRPTLKDIQQFSASIGVAPGITVGRLQFEGILQRQVGNQLKVRYCW
jgi:addiction module antidote protein, HigA family